MAEGPGKYDDIATYARVEADAEGVIVIVLNGHKGSGFSVQCHDGIDPLLLADILLLTANQMRQSVTP